MQQNTTHDSINTVQQDRSRFLRFPKIFLRGTVWRAIFLSLLTMSIIPVGILAFVLIQQSSDALIAEAEQNLRIIVSGRANEIDLRLKEIQNKTDIAAQYAAHALQQPIDVAAIAKTNKRYLPDQRKIIGLDEVLPHIGW